MIVGLSFSFKVVETLSRDAYWHCYGPPMGLLRISCSAYVVSIESYISLNFRIYDDEVIGVLPWLFVVLMKC